METLGGSGGGGGGVKLYSHNLRDFLRVKEDEHRSINQVTSSNGDGDRRDSSSLTLLAVLTEKRPPPPPVDDSRRRVHSSRTLLDIIREDQISRLGSARTEWQQLRDKIRLRHGSGSSLPSSVPVPASDATLDNHNRQTAITTRSGESTQPSISVTQPNPHQEIEIPNRRIERTISLPTESNTSANASPTEEVAPEQPARISLMTLLAENDRDAGLDGSSCLPCENEAVDIGCSSSGAVTGADNNNCCVCMMREKGAAFIPCGHTFCRVCSRELWVQRGNCPLCNNNIIEVLDIF